MRVGFHLPQFPTGGPDNGPALVRDVVTAVADHGFDLVATNDNLLFPSAADGPQRPWLDGPSTLALAAGVPTARPLSALCLVLPLLRGAAMTARTLSGLNVLLGGRLTAALAAGSSPRARSLAGVGPTGTGAALEEATPVIRGLLGHGATASVADPVAGVGRLRAADVEPPPPPVWHASWGSDAGLARLVRVADGWLASAYTLDPSEFAARRTVLRRLAEEAGRDPDDLRSGLATAFTYVTDGTEGGPGTVRARLSGLLGREVEETRDLVGTPERVRDRVAAYRDAGADLLLLLPVLDPVGQVARIADVVAA